MTEHLTTATSSVKGDERGLDRRKFLLRTTAVTAGAWAAPSILTIDKAFGNQHSPIGCPCQPRVSDAEAVEGHAQLVGQPRTQIHEFTCLNDDTAGTNQPLPADLGSVDLIEISCECGANVSVANLVLNIPNDDVPVRAQALQSHAACDCKTGQPTGGSRVVGLSAFGQTVADETAPRTILIPGGRGFVALNETTVGPQGGTEFNALHIVFLDTLGNDIDLKFASSEVVC